MNKWRQLRDLSTWERRVLIKALVALPVTAIGLRLMRLKQWQRVLARTNRVGLSQSSTDTPPRTDEARRVARIVNIASRRSFYRANCLKQSLVLWWLLKQRHIESQIRFGARKDGDDGILAAHSWVEIDGLVLNDAHDVSDHFPPFTRTMHPAIQEDL